MSCVCLLWMDAGRAGPARLTRLNRPEGTVAGRGTPYLLWAVPLAEGG